MQTIENEKEKTNVFNNASLRFVAMKIGNYSGDIRRVLMITRRAVEIARDRYNELFKKSKSQDIVQVDQNIVV